MTLVEWQMSSISLNKRFFLGLKYHVKSSVINLCSLLILFPCVIDAEEVFEFDSSFLRVSNIDIEQFSYKGYVPPGEYNPSMYLNDDYIQEVSVSVDEKQRLCFLEPVGEALGIDFLSLPKEFLSYLDKNNRCFYLGKIYLKNGTMEYNLSSSKLNIYIPQIYLNKLPRDYISPELWDEGVNAAYLSYNVSGFDSNNGETQTVSSYFNAGINIGSWYFRHKGSASWVSTGGTEYSHINSFIEKPIADIKSKAIIGLSNTEGRLFDTLPTLGTQLRSESLMLPRSQRGYAPQIFGVARTNARVTVSQNDSLIYETVVSPGEFVIDDLYPSGFGGFLEVVIHEADGTEQKFSVPYESSSRLLRPGTHEHSLVAGQYYDESLLEKPLILEATYERGVANAITLYGGLRGNQDYLATKMGVAIGTSVGAFSLDATHANTQLLGEYEDSQGQSYEAQYSKSITSTGSSISIGAYRYNTEGYFSYQEAMKTRDNILRGRPVDSLFDSKNRFIFTGSQELLDDLGQVQVSGSFENYWNDEDYRRQYQLVYSNQFRTVSWGANISRTEDENGDFQTSFGLNFSLPLGFIEEWSPPNLRANFYSDDSRNSQQISISDVVGDDSEFNYGMSITRDSESDGTSFDINTGYVAPVATISASYSRGESYSNKSLSISGAIVGHEGGITLSPFTGDNFGIIEAQGAKNATISGYQQVKIDGNGYAVVPNLQPYSSNRIGVSLEDAPLSIELLQSSERVVPYDKAIVKVKFDTKFGLPILINTSFSGEAIPFGAKVVDENNNLIGNVGQDSKIFVRIPNQKGKLGVSWSSGHCFIQYELSDKQVNSYEFISLNEICQ